LSKTDLHKAQLLLSNRKTILERVNRPGLAILHDQTKQRLGEVERELKADQARQAEQRAKAEVQQRYRLFLDRRKEALFRDTQFTGLMLPLNLDLTRQAAEEALAVFAHRQQGNDWTLGNLPASLSKEERSEIEEGCYELLLVLAEALATQDPRQADRALQILASADRLRPKHSSAYHQRRAFCLARKGDRAGEASELAAAERVPPETAFDHFLSGQQHYKRHQLPEAIQDFEAALQLRPDHFWANCLLGICYVQTARFEASKSCLTACLQTDPEFAWLYLLRGFASGQIGARDLNLAKASPGGDATLKEKAEFEFKEAEADLHAALERLGRAPDDDLHYVLLVNRGLIRFQRGELDQAAADYRAAIRLKKDPFLAHAELAHVYQRQNKPDEAIEELSRAIALKPDWAPLYRGRAEVLQARNDATPAQRQAALSDLEMAIRHEAPGNTILAQDHANRSKLLYRDGRFEDALEASELALQVLPTHVDAHVLKIQVLLKQRHYDEVIRSCDVALAKGNKPSSLLYELRGLAQAAHNDYPGAIRDYGRALEIHPDDGGLLVHRGWAYLVSDAPQLALRDFGAAIELDPADGDAYNGRGTAHARLGDHRAAVADAREALRLGKASPRTTYNAARIYALAAAAAASEVGKNGRQAILLASQYRDRALELVRQALKRESPDKRAAFWRDTIQSDPALATIRRRLKFEEVIATNKTQNP
jgi:tetratricopeptide (TPR) repeat protein